jgi:prevent-host-death family protein
MVNIHDAKTHLSRLLERVAGGEEIVIAKAGRPLAKLVPYREETAPRKLGALQGKVRFGRDWDSAALNEKIADLFQGEDKPESPA